MNLKEDGGWSRKQTLKLISELKQHEVLYKITHPDHLKIIKKNEALQKIVLSLKPIRPSVTLEEIKRKIKVLRQQISQEKKKIRAATRNGMATEDLYVSTLWCFNELQFLLDANDEIRGQSNLMDNSFEDECNTSSKKRPILRKSTNKSMQLGNNLIKNRQKENKEELFCKLLCSELKELKLAQTYDDVTTEMLLLVRKAKAKERKMLSWQLPRTGICSEPLTPVSAASPTSLPSSSSSIENVSYPPFESFEIVTIKQADDDSDDADSRSEIGEEVEIQSEEISQNNDIIQKALEGILNK